VQSDFSTGSRLATSSPNSQIFLKVLAIPAVPLTMSVGFLFGTLYGTMLVSISGTVCLFFFHNEMLLLKVLNFPFMLDS
jgi:hypothetical protein